MADPASYAYRPPNVAEAYGPPARSPTAMVPSLATQDDALAIERGRDQASSEMLDEGLDRAFQRAK
jgi:hypothetical protein